MRALDHPDGERRLGREGRVVGHMRRRHAGRIVRPGLRQIQRPVDEGVAVARHIGGEDADLAVGDLARRAGVLPRHAARRLALLEKAGLIDHQHRISVGQVLERHSRARCRAAHPRPSDRGPGWPAAATGRDRPPPRPASSRSCAARRPSSPSRNCPADAATRSCVNSGRIRAFTSRSDDAQKLQRRLDRCTRHP